MLCSGQNDTLIIDAVIFCYVFICPYIDWLTHGCRSNTGIIGHTGKYVHYKVDVKGNTGTLVCCEATACGKASFAGCKWQLYPIGCGFISFSGRLYWGKSTRSPIMRCKGIQLGTYVWISH